MKLAEMQTPWYWWLLVQGLAWLVRLDACFERVRLRLLSWRKKP